MNVYFNVVSISDGVKEMIYIFDWINQACAKVFLMNWHQNIFLSITYLKIVTNFKYRY